MANQNWAIRPASGIIACMITRLRSLWGYERMVHRQCIQDLEAVVRFSPKVLAFSSPAVILGLAAVFFWSGPNAALDQFTYTCGVVGASLLVYGFYRVLAPVRLMEKQTALTEQLKKETQFLEEKLQPKLEIGFDENDPRYFFESPYFRSERPIDDIIRAETPNDWRLCRISIKNLSTASTVRNVEVKLVQIEKCPDHLKGKLPLRLHFMHDNDNPPTHRLDLNPGSPQFVDVVMLSLDLGADGPPDFVLTHSEIGIEAKLPIDDYKVTIEVSAKDATSLSRAFCIGMREKDEAGLTIWMWPV
jgi:hypothetical protein